MPIPALGSPPRRWNTTVQTLVASYEAYEDLMKKSQEGKDFYTDLEAKAAKLLEKARAACQAAEANRQQILEKELKKQPPPRPTAPKPALPKKPPELDAGDLPPALGALVLPEPPELPEELRSLPPDVLAGHLARLPPPALAALAAGLRPPRALLACGPPGQRPAAALRPRPLPGAPRPPGALPSAGGTHRGPRPLSPRRGGTAAAPAALRPAAGRAPPPARPLPPQLFPPAPLMRAPVQPGYAGPAPRSSPQHGALPGSAPAASYGLAQPGGPAPGPLRPPAPPPAPMGGPEPPLGARPATTTVDSVQAPISSCAAPPRLPSQGPAGPPGPFLAPQRPGGAPCPLPLCPGGAAALQAAGPAPLPSRAAPPTPLPPPHSSSPPRRQLLVPRAPRPSPRPPSCPRAGPLSPCPSRCPPRPSLPSSPSPAPGGRPPCHRSSTTSCRGRTSCPPRASPPPTGGPCPSPAAPSPCTPRWGGCSRRCPPVPPLCPSAPALPPPAASCPPARRVPPTSPPAAAAPSPGLGQLQGTVVVQGPLVPSPAPSPQPPLPLQPPALGVPPRPSPAVPPPGEGPFQRQSSSTDDLLSSSPESQHGGPKAAGGHPLLQPTKADAKDGQRPRAVQLIENDPYEKPERVLRLLEELDRFRRRVEGLERPGPGGSAELDLVWKELQEAQERDARQLSIAIARCYSMKNRHQDIMPYDRNRIVLRSGKDDYINASRVEDLSPYCPAVIATQAPLLGTAADFWLMIYEQKVSVIVMLVSEQELDKPRQFCDSVLGGPLPPDAAPPSPPHSRRCCGYFPPERGQPLVQGPVTLVLTSLKVAPTHVERMITLQYRDQSLKRTVVHLQFTSWPELGLPDSKGSLLQFIQEVHGHYLHQRPLHTPVVVHCSSGVGRTGAFCLLYAAVQELEAGNGIPDLAQLVRRMRRQRKHMLQEKLHLKFCYEAVLLQAERVLHRHGAGAPPGPRPPNSASPKVSVASTSSRTPRTWCWGGDVPISSIQATIAKLSIKPGGATGEPGGGWGPDSAPDPTDMGALPEATGAPDGVSAPVPVPSPPQPPLPEPPGAPESSNHVAESPEAGGGGGGAPPRRPPCLLAGALGVPQPRGLHPGRLPQGQTAHEQAELPAGAGGRRPAGAPAQRRPPQHARPPLDPQQDV
ncbi:unnamed protein product, partial [Bubo scandiacus]